MRLGMLALAMVLTGGAIPALAVQDAAPRSDALAFQGRTATMQRSADGSFDLQPAGAGAADSVGVDIATQAMASDTGSLVFDGLFALAQQEMRQDRVTAIVDGAFDNGRPLPCDCYQTGAKWPYVWTRDVSYAADLALARLDPERMRRTLSFKLSDVRAAGMPPGRYVTQDTGSGGSWPVSTDRVVWFLGARHLLDDPAFAADTVAALRDTLAQDRRFAFDAELGLYRGETSFLDWREQTYPAWTATDVRYIADSFALSTNVLHYEALQLAARLGKLRGDAGAATYTAQALSLAQAIDSRFWNPTRGMYRAYIGGASDAASVELYDLLGISLAALSGAVPEARARQSLANYPATDAGSPVIWPQQPGIAIYHNRASWPFVSAYALRAARKLDMPARIAHESRALMRGAALAGSNMENFELTTLLPHVDDGALSGPVVNSPRQLWSVAGYLDMVLLGVFGVEADGRISPKIPVVLVSELFGTRDAIVLRMGGDAPASPLAGPPVGPSSRTITLQLPEALDGNLLVAGDVQRHGDATVVQLRAITVPDTPMRTGGARFAPSSPALPVATATAHGWRITAPGAQQLFVDGTALPMAAGVATLPMRAARQCISALRVDVDAVASLPSPALCLGEVSRVVGNWPRRWIAQHDGRQVASLRYDNQHGPINTGVTAAVRQLSVTCGAAPAQVGTLVLPHSAGMQASTSMSFEALQGDDCTFALREAPNMSGLQHFARYTGGAGGAGGASGPLNAAHIDALEIAFAGAQANTGQHP